MLSHEKVTELLSRFTYKPNWRFEVLPPNHAVAPDQRRVSIHVSQYVEDSRARYDPWDLRPEEPDPFSYPPSQSEYWVPEIWSPRRRILMVGGRVEVPPIAKDREDRFWIWLHDVAIPSLERHEISEWFKVDGRLKFDPHEERR